MSTARAILDLPASLGIPHHRDHRRRARVGADDEGWRSITFAPSKPTYSTPASTLDTADAAIAKAAAGLDAIQRGFTGYGRGLLQSAYGQLGTAYDAASVAGATAAARNLAILMGAVADAEAKAGQGFGAAFSGFWGGSPKDFLDDALDRLQHSVDEAAIIVGIALLGGVYIATTLGGQAYLSSVGAGVGRSLPELAGGASSLMRSTGAGYSRLLGELPGATVRGIEAWSPKMLK